MKNYSNQRGMTLIETIIALGISSVIILALTAAVYTIMNVTGRGNAEIMALRDVQSAAFWISNDTQMASDVTLEGGGDPAEGMTVEWTDYSGSPHSSIYSLSDTQLLRNYDDTTSVIAQYVSLAEFSVTDEVLTYTIVSTPPGSWNTNQRVKGHVILRAYLEE